MKLVDPVVYVENYDGKKIMKNIERACRICYRSEDKITEDSYKNLITNCIKVVFLNGTSCTADRRMHRVPRALPTVCDAISYIIFIPHFSKIVKSFYALFFA